MNILVFDTETLGKSKEFSIYDNYVFDLGYVLYNTEAQMLRYGRHIVTDIYEDASLVENYFAGPEVFNKYYGDNLKGQTIEFNTFNWTMNTLKETLEYFKVDAIAAYNINFDLRALKATAKKLDVNIDFLDNYPIIDIYHMACQALQGNELYIANCVEHGKISEKGNINSNAEAVYCFIKNDYSFVEEHTALSDAKIELEILEWLFNYEKENNITLNREPYSACWRLVQPKKKK